MDDKAFFFTKANSELDTIISNNETNKFNEWKKKTLLKLDGHYRFRLERMDIDNLWNISYYGDSVDELEVNDTGLNHIKSILRDMYWKYKTKKLKTKKNIETKKLLQARENNLDFDQELAEMICGDNDKFPYRSSHWLTDFFNKLGHDFTHDGTTRKVWVEDRLRELDITYIHNIISNGLLNKKFFKEYYKKNPNLEIDLEIFYNKAQLEFKNFIKESSEVDKSFNLSNVLDLNVNIELFFDNKAKTKDIELNKLIEEAKERFLSNDKQIALEKLWDSFERLKTHFDSNKKTSSTKVVDKISENFDKDFINNEFKALTIIGNSYRIRHHEVDKKELNNQHINYFFFRMLSLVDLYLIYFNKQ